MCLVIQVPDIDAVVHFQDLPVAVLPQFAESAPLFSYASNDDFVDVPFPDWTYWGNMAHNQPASWQASITASSALAVCLAFESRLLHEGPAKHLQGCYEIGKTVVGLVSGLAACCR